jgi:hypothetical protein
LGVSRWNAGKLRTIKVAHLKLFSRIDVIGAAITVLFTLIPIDALALPVFARQTGQNCVACHAGGQFPELTPYGRAFKMTAYTIGTRTIPLSVMGVVSYADVGNTSKSDDPGADFQRNGTTIIANASVFLAGKITDNIGAFVQATYDNYASQSPDGSFAGHFSADNMDFRYADHFIDVHQDLIIGVSVNNNPSVSDPWNTAAAWMQYVPVPSPTSYQFIDGAAPYPGYGAGGNIAGITVYGFWQRTLYVEVGTYRTATGPLSFMSFNIHYADTTHLSGGNNPYWRVALSHEWGAHNIMVGTSGMVAHVYDLGSDISDAGNLGRFRNTGFDAQYQYLLDPHTVTGQFAYMRQYQRYSANSLAGASPYFLADGVTPVAPFNSSDTTSVVRAKVAYIYQAKYGGSLSYFSETGSTNTLNQSSGYDSNGQITSTDPLGTGIASTRVNGNLSGNPATRGLTFEAFYMPVQYLRVGAQYTAYSKYNGAADNYDGLGRNAADNNTLFLYAWAAY